MAAQIQNALTILRRKQVEARTGLSRSTIYAKLRRNPKRPSDYDPTFPKPVTKEYNRYRAAIAQGDEATVPYKTTRLGLEGAMLLGGLGTRNVAGFEDALGNGISLGGRFRHLEISA